MTATAVLDGPDEPLAATKAQDAPKKRGGGPRTQAGRDSSKRNALKHGMMAKEVFPEDLAAEIQAAVAELVAQFRPTTAYELRLVTDMGRAHAQINRCVMYRFIDV